MSKGKGKIEVKIEVKTEDEGGLCWRCENRAQFHELGHAPRCECGDVTKSNWSCYCYRPVRPIVLQANENDDRPLGGPWMFSSRAHRVGLGDVELHGLRTKAGLLQYWVPKETGRKPRKA